MTETSVEQTIVHRRKSFGRYFAVNKALYAMLVPGLLVLLVFRYLPMYGLIISFQHFHPAVGIAASRWVGFAHFVNFFSDPYFVRLIRNTFLLGLYTLIIGFPAPIVFAILLNELRVHTFKRVVQTISYMPHFLSIVVVIGLLRQLTSMSDGVINDMIESLGGARIHFFARPEWFRPLYITSVIWQGVGFGSILYLAAIAGINPELYESAVMDGANRFAQIWHITLPSILPTITILFILAVGGILGNDFQRVLLMYSPFNYETADVVQTYVYRVGLESPSPNFSYAAAVGLFMAVISLVFLIVTNRLAKTVGESSLW